MKDFESLRRQRIAGELPLTLLIISTAWSDLARALLRQVGPRACEKTGQQKKDESEQGNDSLPTAEPMISRT
ncbi:MAG: hypothetical protein MK108_16135 [Mariniblastus sp.]|nr:hypothetical protein [Mariniblastus sp.]